MKKAGVNPVLDLIKNEKIFLAILLFGFLSAAIFLNNFYVAMWIGFAFAAYSAIANDSIQTIGTFIGSNMKQKWYHLWLFIGGIFLITVTASYLIFDGDVSWQRLAPKADGRDLYPHPTSFSYLQIAAPLVLLILTRLKMPVSTTILLLSSFSAQVDGISKMLMKSLGGYFLAFVIAIIVWAALNSLIKKYFSKRKPRKGWMLFQWIISGALWAVWIMQDAANIAVYLPRQLSIWEFVGFAGFIFLGLGVLFYQRGDRIQQVVSKKTKIADVRAATLVDLVYALIMVYKLLDSTIPMSTTWVFLGLLGGREVAMNFMRNKEGNMHILKAFKVAGKDAGMALIGLVISIALAMGINDGIRQDLFNLLGF
ncbi:MAG TPA: hypothetical protein DIW47_04435 [Bacteroidetes bacterium]|nr:hypothetical protein [Bacteroidota bacterium]